MANARVPLNDRLVFLPSNVAQGTYFQNAVTNVTFERWPIFSTLWESGEGRGICEAMTQRYNMDNTEVPLLVWAGGDLNDVMEAIAVRQVECL